MKEDIEEGREKIRKTAAILENIQMVGQNILQSFRCFTQQKK